MLVRNLTLTNTSLEKATECLLRQFESRKCSVAQTATAGVLEYFGLFGTSSLTQGYGSISVVSVDNIVEIQIGLQTSLSLSGALLLLLSLLASIPLIGIPLLLFLILHDQAAGRVTHELDLLVDEIYRIQTSDAQLP